MTQRRSLTDGIELDPSAKPKNWLIAIAIITAAFALLFGGSYAVIDGNRTNSALCKAQLDNRTSMRRLLQVAELDALQSAASLREAVEIQERFARLRAVVPPLKCSDGKPVEVTAGAGGN